MTTSKAQRGHDPSEVAREEGSSQNQLDPPDAAPTPGAAREAPTRAILEDRYDGLLMRRRSRYGDPNLLATGSAGDYNRFQLKLDAVLRRIVEGTIRRPMGDADGRLVGELEAIIRERVVEWALEHPEPVR